MNSLSIRILIGLVLGLASGAMLAAMQIQVLDQCIAIAHLIGNLWLDALKMTIVPLIFGLLVTGLANAANNTSASKVAGRAIAWFVGLLFGACAVSALATSFLLELWPVTAPLIPLEKISQPPPIPSTAEWLRKLIPTNPIQAAAENATVPLVIFSLLFGFASTRIDKSLRGSMITSLQAVVETMLVIVHGVLWFAPLGILGLAFTAGAQMGFGPIHMLAHYILLMICICLLIICLTYGIVVIVGRISLFTFTKAVLSTQVIAISTQSSLASLPAMIKASETLGASREVSDVVIPLGSSLFRVTSAAVNIAVAIYLAHLYNIPLSFPVLLIGIGLAGAISLAAVGLPAQVSYFTTIGPVCLGMGVPIEMLPLLLAVETIPDLFRTIGNVTVDLAVVRIVGRQ